MTSTKIIREQVFANGFDPYEHRHRPNLTVRSDTLINLIKGTLGIGLLGIPEAFKIGGLVGGLILSLILYPIIIYMLHLTYYSMYYLCKRDMIPQVTYYELIKLSLEVGPKCLTRVANVLAHLANVFIILFQYGVLCAYVSFTSTCMSEVVEATLNTSIAPEIYTIYFLVPIFLISLFPNLPLITALSNLGNSLLLISFLGIFYFFFETIEPFSERRLSPDFREFSVFVGHSMFSFLSIGTILSIEYNMEEGQLWGGRCGVLNQTMLLVSIIYIFTGFFGYLKYGDEVVSPIILNLEMSHPIVWVIELSLALSIFFTFTIHAYAAVEILWISYIEKHPLMWNFLLRMIVVSVTFLTVILIPNVQEFGAFFGSFFLTIICVVFPALTDICLRWPDDFGRYKFIFIKDVILLSFGLILFFICSHFTSLTIINNL